MGENLLNSVKNTNMNMNKVVTDLNVEKTATSVSYQSLDVSGNYTIPFTDFKINYLDGKERCSEIGDNFIHVSAPGNMQSIAVNTTSECELNPIWTKNESSASEVVESDDVPIVINEHENESRAESNGGDMSGADMTGMMAMIMNMLRSK